MGSPCMCECHANPYLPCNTPGGCGSQHRTGGCTTCPVLRPDSTPRDPHTPPVCDGDRRLLNRWLGEIADLHADLSQPEEPVIDQRRSERWTRDHKNRLRNRGIMWNDPLAPLGGVSPINSRSKQPSVTGSRERPIPINTSVVDLTAVRRAHNLTSRAPADDQIGHLPVATVLDEWARDIRDQALPDHHLPEPAVDQQIMWLRVRLDIICDRHPDVAGFAESIRVLRGALRVAAGQTDPQPERCDGVPCKRCDLLTLFRQADGDVHCITPDCQAVLRDEEYQEWVATLAAELRIKQRQHT
jgi:hypothetical protein